MTLRAVVAGGGITGSAAAMYLSAMDLDVTLVEAGADIGGAGATRANTAIVHGGYDPEPGSLKARLNVRGCELYARHHASLGIPYRRSGSLVVARTDTEMSALEELLRRGLENGAAGLELLDQDGVLAMEPNLRENFGGLYCSSAGIVHPMIAALCFAGCAHRNGARILRGVRALGVRAAEGELKGLETSAGFIPAHVVINAAGTGADALAASAGLDRPVTTARKGQWALLSREHPHLVSMPVFPAPSELGKGITVSPTIDGDYLLGPTAEDNDDPEDLGTDGEGIEAAVSGAENLVSGIDRKFIIRHFAGIRAISGHDFVIGPTELPGFYNAGGMCSPGLAAAPASGEYLAELVARYLDLDPPGEFQPAWEPYRLFRDRSMEEQEAMVRSDPAHARVLCRCDMVTEGDVRALSGGPLGAVDLDGLKRRSKLSAGLCQGARCFNGAAAVMAEVLGVPVEDIRKEDGGRLYGGRLR